MSSFRKVQSFHLNQDQHWLVRQQTQIKKLISRFRQKIIKESKIYVSTYNATTYLEAFAINIPTIIFWNPKHWEIRESAKNIFSELELVKIFHSNPESAAKHIQNIWSDVDELWKNDEVQRTLMRFNQKYNRSPSALLELIKNEIEELV